MNVLVTGANGFVGRRLVTRLVADGHAVIAATGPAAGAPASLPPKVKRVALDLADEASVNTVVQQPCDAVVHLAAMALAREANRHPAETWSVNAHGTARLAHQFVARGAPAPRFLVVSSSEVYLPAQRPNVESDPVGPVTPYGASKLGAELAALQAWRCGGLQVIVARSFVHSGPGQDPQYWLPGRCALLREAKRKGWAAVGVGDLSAVRDFTHVDDVVDAYARLLQQGKPGEVYNIASGQAVTLDEVHTRLEQLIGVSPKREVDASQQRRDARPYLVGDTTKLRVATGWAPRHSLDDLLKDLVDAQAD